MHTVGRHHLINKSELADTRCTCPIYKYFIRVKQPYEILAGLRSYLAHE